MRKEPNRKARPEVEDLVRSSFEKHYDTARDIHKLDHDKARRLAEALTGVEMLRFGSYN